ncbi:MULTISPECIES: flagellar basal-body MS-ring/collar protein FliF [Idiomarina]|jgi:flagellar M-ring protein FliF|uniref:flagellar basal-body MS-ring/collar protein FliF n=1 Tax=Idiomarina TaxID=135575 RepID=UPI00241C4C17|nr:MULTISPECIES: flagellar basal-body MS-ring/collar protein FliF [Idiomarina]|tara:strand:- start:19307 stop:20998 length:1692 start_codon:yes stop_codon:yes gene_type:complete
MVQDTDLPESNRSGNDDGGEKTGIMTMLGNFDMLRQVIVVLALAICVAIAVFIMLWAQESTYRPLGQMETEELISTLDYMDANGIEYQVEGSTVSVPEESYDAIKLQLTRAGVDYGNSTNNGSEILMSEPGFGVSQRLERERLIHSREVQLARAIEEIKKVAGARVLLAVPKENVFARREKQPKASVMLNVRGGTSLSEEEVASIVDMVASSVTGLNTEHVTVTDQAGRLLNSGSQSALAAKSSREYQIEQKREKEYLEKIDSILIPVLGYDNYTAQVDVTMDFTQREETQRQFNPDMPAIRSEMTVENRSVGSAIGGIPGALTNQPPLDSDIPEEAGAGAAGGGGNGSTHREATRNYELDNSVTYTRNQTGTIKRLSVSVAVNHEAVAGEAGEGETQSRSAEEMANIRRLLQGGLGFDINRGDSIEVVSVPFAQLPDLGVGETPVWEEPWFWRAFRLVMGALVIMVLILAVVRPMLKKLMNPESGVEDDAEAFLDEESMGDETIDLLSSQFDESAVGFGADGSLQLPDLHKDEDLLKAVRALVANEPELSSQVVKAWLNEDA